MTLTQCADFLRTHDDYILLTHTRPDGDTLCSAAALCDALRAIGKRAFVLENQEANDPYLTYVAPYFCASDRADAVHVSVDVADTGMLLKGYCGTVDLKIDHHPNGGAFAPQILLAPAAAACGELVMDLIDLLCGSISRTQATLLYIAIATDCGCFMYGNTNEQTFLHAARLCACGVENGPLNKLLFRSLSRARLTLEGMVYTSIKPYRDGKINVAVITQQMLRDSGVTEADCDDLASLAGKIKGNVVAITVREQPDGTSRASVRTNREVNASEICAAFGGGGHAMAAGCSCDMEPYQFAEVLVARTNEVWQ